MSPGPAALDPKVRLMRRVEIDDESGCWIWTGAIASRTGYGRIRVGSRVDNSVRTEFTHRLSYELHVGPIPAGLDLDHLCRVRACCNPEHLEPVTRGVNLARGNNPPKATCHRQHPEDRQTVSKQGRRVCLDCAIIRTRASKERLRV